MLYFVDYAIVLVVSHLYDVLCVSYTVPNDVTTTSLHYALPLTESSTYISLMIMYHLHLSVFPVWPLV